MRSRSLGIIFIAAVIVPSILLAVLSIRSAGREEAYRERQMATTLDAEVTHAAGLAGAEVGRVIDDLRSALDVPAGADYGKILTRWKSATSLVAVPFLLSPQFGILWPPADGRTDSEQKRFLQENGAFLSDRSTTTVLQNIAVRYQNEILAENNLAQDNKAAPQRTPPQAARQQAAPSQTPPLAASKAVLPRGAPQSPQRVAAPQAQAESRQPQPAAESEAAAGAAAPASASSRSASAATAHLRRAASEAPAQSAPSARQMAIDTFAQNPDVQTRVYEEAREKGDQLNARVVEPMAQDGQLSGSAAPGAVTADANAAESAAAAPAPAAPEESERATADMLKSGAAAADSAAAGKDRAYGGSADQSRLKDKSLAGAAPPKAAASGGAPAGAARGDEAAKPAPSLKKSTALAKEMPSQFVLTSQLLSQIASRGDAGLIPRFIGEKLVFLFWERQRDGRIAGCEIASEAFRGRIAGVLTSTWSPVRILTLLDENGGPLATPPDSADRDWRRPFVAREIGESLPRWEAAAYLTKPDAISAQARSSSLLIWIMVMILFVSVAGGGTMVLSSVYGEMKLAQQKATFVTNVSHELKTPLTSIGLFVDLLRRKGPLSAAKKEQYLSLMASETERLTRLINNVLDFSRDRTARRYSIRTVDAAEVASQIVESQRVRLESRGFSLSLETGSKAGSSDASAGIVAAVRADPEALKQVLLNLMSNAEKYSAEKKQIVVAVSRETAAILIRVCDRGIGVPEHEREKVFQEFYRVDDSLSSGVQGTGLGLTIARRIARDHGGDITCAPRDGGGTEFVVRLPSADGGEASA